MSTVGLAKVFMHGRSQAVRLPKEFRLPGTDVRVRRVGRALLLEPIDFDAKGWMEQLGRYHVLPFMIDDPSLSAETTTEPAETVDAADAAAG